jgi:hypothetical protein
MPMLRPAGETRQDQKGWVGIMSHLFGPIHRYYVWRTSHDVVLAYFCPHLQGVRGERSICHYDGATAQKCHQIRDRRHSQTRRCSLPIVSRQSLSFVLMEDSVVDVRAKLLKDVQSSVDRYTRQPELIGLYHNSAVLGRDLSICNGSTGCPITARFWQMWDTAVLDPPTHSGNQSRGLGPSAACTA